MATAAASPSFALRVPPLGGSNVDPFRMMGEAMDLRTKQANWMAMNNLSGIMATSNGDYELMRQRASQDPYASFMLPQLETMATIGLRNAQTKTQAYDQQRIAADTANTTNRTGMDVVTNAIRLSGGNADNFARFAQAGVQSMNPDAAREVGPLVRTITNTAIDASQGEDQRTRNMNFSNWAFSTLVGTGMHADQAGAMLTGYLPGITDIGGEAIPTLRGVAPGTMGGMVISGQGGPTVIPPLVPGQQPMPIQGPQQQQQAPPPVAPPIAGGGAPAPTQTAGPGAPSPAPASPQEAATAPQQGTAGDGTALYPPNLPETGPRGVVSPLTGGMALGAGERKRNEAEMGEFNSEQELRDFRGAQNSLGNLQQIDAAINNLQSTGGFLTPGARLPERTRVANTLNTLASGLGMGPIFNPTNVGSAELLNKQLQTMTMQLASTQFGGQREAAVTVQRIAESVPGMENTYMGSKMMIASIRATMQRAIDLRNFKNQWIEQHGQTILGSDEAFNQLHPISEYINRELAPFGINSDGQFRDVDALKSAWTHHLIDDKTALAVAKQRGW